MGEKLRLQRPSFIYLGEPDKLDIDLGEKTIVKPLGVRSAFDESRAQKNLANYLKPPVGATLQRESTAGVSQFQFNTVHLMLLLLSGISLGVFTGFTVA